MILQEYPYICIHCGASLKDLYEQYGDTHIRLTVCTICHNVADKYIEYDNVLLFIDLMLIKPAAYRHTIYNVLLVSGNPLLSSKKITTKLNTTPNTKPPPWNVVSPAVRLAILMLLFEVYVSWAYQEKSFIDNVNNTSLIISLVLCSPIQYFYFLSVTVLQNAILCVSLAYFGLQWLKFPPKTAVLSNNSTPLPSRCSSPATGFKPPLSSPTSTASLRPNSRQLLRVPTNQSAEPTAYLGTSASQTPAVTSTASSDGTAKPSFQRLLQIMCTTVLISNTIKLFPIVMLIWPYDPPILHATRLLLRIVHLLLLIEAVHIVIIDPKLKTRKTRYNRTQFVQANVYSSSNNYSRIALVVIVSELCRIVVSHVIIIFMASAIWGVSIREIGLDDWKMFHVGLKLLEELGRYILGDL